MSTYRPPSQGWETTWEKEQRPDLWRRMVRHLHGADAVDNHGLSVPDAERLATAAVYEVRLFLATALGEVEAASMDFEEAIAMFRTRLQELGGAPEIEEDE